MYAIQLLLLIVGNILVLSVHGLDIESCTRPLGMESGTIRDDQLSASSAFDPNSTGPVNSRLNVETGSGAWCPASQINATSHEWIQVELPEESLITAVRTQGRWDKGRGLEFPSAYMIEYWRPSLGRWARYRDGLGNEIIPANSDTQTSILRLLDGGIVAKLVRLIPVSESVRTVCLRFELHGCSYKEPISSYSSPVGALVDSLDFRDANYDGTIGIEALKRSGNRSDSQLQWMHGGLGRLFDGAIGKWGSNIEEGGGSSLHGWIGWHRSQQNLLPNREVPLKFTFSRRQNLSAILLHTFRHPQRGFRWPSLVRLHFAPIGDEFTARHNFWMPKDAGTDEIGPLWRRIEIQPSRVVSKLLIELKFADSAEWMLLSEIRFISEDVIPEDQWPSAGSTFNYSEIGEENNEQNDDQRLDGDGCFFIVLLALGGICFASGVFCLCLMAIGRLQNRHRHHHRFGHHSPLKAPIKMFGSNSRNSSSSGCSSGSSGFPSSTSGSPSPPASSFPSKSFHLRQHLLQNGQKKKRVPGGSKALLKCAVEEKAELMDFARLLMRSEEARTGKMPKQRSEDVKMRETEEEEEQYADPDENSTRHTLNSGYNGGAAPVVSSAIIRRPAQLQLQSSSRQMPTFSRTRLLQMATTNTFNGGIFEGGNSSDFSTLDRSPSSILIGECASTRYRATPTLAHFPGCHPPSHHVPLMPPPLPMAPPPMRPFMDN